ncbi:sialin-like [Daktulosphaira vitifoliae]|uniref:sialin-like n=1 Tax=Daktulosphaira vitifoliae TaxID=58002 RepID=UPI0021A99538|nr:sialin-like [Daktulosphaira vitifoliae]
MPSDSSMDRDLGPGSAAAEVFEKAPMSLVDKLRESSMEKERLKLVDSLDSETLEYTSNLLEELEKPVMEEVARLGRRMNQMMNFIRTPAGRNVHTTIKGLIVDSDRICKKVTEVNDLSAKTRSSWQRKIVDVKSTKKPKLWGSCRIVVAFSVFLAAMQSSLLRDNLGLALLCMSKPSGNYTCGSNDAVIPTIPGYDSKKNCEFEWDLTLRGRLLGGFFYGYIITTMVGGYMSTRYGPKTPFMWGGIGNTFFHSLCPIAATVHTELFFACRFLQGLLSGLMIGPLFQLFSPWTTEEEAASLLSFGFSGFALGTIISNPLSGILCSFEYNGYGGWPLIFYVPASISVFFIIFWYQYLYDVPDNHPKITQEEYNYLLENIDISNEPAIIPWLSIFTSMPFIAYIFSYTVFMWNYLTMMNSMPIFMQSMLHLSSRENGLLNCIPYTLSFIVRLFNAQTYSLVRRNLRLSNTVGRKLYHTIGCFCIIVAYIYMIAEENITKWKIIGAMTVILALGDIAYTGGFFPTLLEMAPNYAGLLSGIATFASYTISSSSLLINSIIIRDSTKSDWNNLLGSIVGMFIFIIIFYIIFGSASLQKWSRAQNDIHESAVASRSTLLMTRSYGMSRTMSMRRPTHMF